MRVAHHRLIVPVAAALALVASVAVAEPQAAAPPLRIDAVSVEGRAMWRAGDESKWQPISAGDALPVGVQVRTGLRARVRLNVGPNAEVIVEPLTKLTVLRLAFDDQTGAIRTQLAVRFGKLAFDVKHVGFTNDFTIVSPTNVAAVKGTRGTYGCYDGPAEITGFATNGPRAIRNRHNRTGQSSTLPGAARVGGAQQQPFAMADKLANTGGGLVNQAGGRMPTANPMFTTTAGISKTLNGNQSRTSTEKRARDIIDRCKRRGLSPDDCAKFISNKLGAPLE